METKLRTRKRKQQSNSNPFEGIFTRSKSQIYYLHPNRSGRSRSDDIRRRHHAQLLNTKPNSRSGSLIIDDTPHSSVKDLRARRVFSPASIIQDYGGIDELDSEIDLKNPNSFSTVEELVEKDEGFSVAESSNPNFEIIGDPFFGNDDAPLAPNSSDQDGLSANLTEECVQMTPVELEADGDTSKDDVGRKDDSISKGQVGLNFRSRRKVFKAPSSFSYKRLLPYLMDINQDDSCVSKIDIVDLALPCDAQNLVGLVPKSSVTRDLRIAGKGQETGGQSDDRKPVVEYGGFDTTDTCKFLNKNYVNPNFAPTQECRRFPNVEERCDNSGLSSLMEECDQMTPPDADVFSKVEVNDSLARKGENVLINGNPSNIIRNGGVVENLEEQKNDSISKSKRVLNPCVRMKLLKTPSSVSYRRLLPFLMDIAKDDSCSLKVDQCPKDEKDFGQKPLPRIRDSSNHDNPGGKSEIVSDAGKQDSRDENPSSPTPSFKPNDGSSDGTTQSLLVTRQTFTGGKSNIKEPNVVNFTNSTEPHIPPDSQLEVKLLLEHFVQDSPGKLEQEPTANNLSHGHEANSSSSICSTADHENMPRECALGISGNYLLDAKDDCTGLKTSIDERNAITLNMNQNLSSIERFDPSGVHVDGPKKGILKRNPRGCRGLCNCLKCASFRLHAERAFEFSRDQMLDAEEVAVELIEELTCLRHILEKSAVDANHVTVVQGNQVKGACMKALQTEERAKKRIAQMNEDLSIHCRRTALPRPRVSFASNVEEKVIAKARLPGK